MTRFKTLALATILSTSLLSVAAAAQPNADANQDGIVTRAEFDLVSNTRFTNTDANGDGYISKSEREIAKENHAAEQRSEYFGRIDQNGDGVVSLDEFNQGMDDRQDHMRERRHDRRDLNDDGQIDQEDRQAMREKYLERREDRRENRTEHHPRHEQGQGSRSGQRDHWSRIDANGDDLISLQEYQTGADIMFEHLDVDGDGVLSQGEGQQSRRKPEGQKRKRFFRR